MSPPRRTCFTDTVRRNKFGFRFQIFTVGNFIAAKQQPILPSLTITPQPDSACPAARKQFETGNAKRQENFSGAPYNSVLNDGVVWRIELILFRCIPKG